MDQIMPYTSLLEAFDLFSDEYGEKEQLALKSVRNYLSAVNNFRNWLIAHGIPNPQVRHINEANMRAFLKSRSHVGDRTYNIQLSYYSVFFEWLVTGRYIPENPMKILGKRKSNNTVYKKAFLAEDRIPEFVEIASRKHPRDQALFVYACQAGRRESEVAALTIGDIEWEKTSKYKHGCYTFTEKKKSGKRVKIAMTQTMRTIFEWWLEEYRKIAVHQYILTEGKPLPANWKVFPPFFRGPARKKDPLNRHLNPIGEMTTIGDMATEIAKEMGIYHLGFGSHALRRASAMLVYRIGGLRAVRGLLAHESEETSAKYIDQEEEELFLIGVLEQAHGVPEIGQAVTEEDEGDKGYTEGAKIISLFSRSSA